MVFPGRMLVEQKSMICCEVLLNADASFKRLQVNIALPPPFYLHFFLVIFLHLLRCFLDHISLYRNPLGSSDLRLLLLLRLCPFL